jgi:hypothetical protein
MTDAGRHIAHWDGRELHGHAAPAGVYFERLDWAGAIRTRRIVRLASR